MILCPEGDLTQLWDAPINTLWYLSTTVTLVIVVPSKQKIFFRLFENRFYKPFKPFLKMVWKRFVNRLKTICKLFSNGFSVGRFCSKCAEFKTVCKHHFETVFVERFQTVCANGLKSFVKTIFEPLGWKTRLHKRLENRLHKRFETIRRKRFQNVVYKRF